VCFVPLCCFQTDSNDFPANTAKKTEISILSITLDYKTYIAEHISLYNTLCGIGMAYVRAETCSCFLIFNINKCYVCGIFIGKIILSWCKVWRLQFLSSVGQSIYRVIKKSLYT
jgi:hypothetical protein